MEHLPPTETPPPEPRLDTATLGILGISLTVLTSLDFFLHQHQGVSDPALRSLYTAYLGGFTSHLGNFGFAAAATIPLSAGKKVLERLNLRGETQLGSSILEFGYRLGLAGLFALIIASESFPDNPEFLGDVATSFAGIVSAKLVTEEVVSRFFLGRNRDLPQKLDKLGYLDDVATNPDELFR